MEEQLDSSIRSLTGSSIKSLEEGLKVVATDDPLGIRKLKAPA